MRTNNMAAGQLKPKTKIGFNYPPHRTQTVGQVPGLVGN